MALNIDKTVQTDLYAHCEDGAIPLNEKREIALSVYVKVARVDATKLTANAYVSSNGAITEYTFVPDMNGGNFIAQAYAHLKTLPEFADATDC